MVEQRGFGCEWGYMLVDALGEGLESGDVPAGSEHLCDKEEADGGGEHVGCDAGEVVGVVLQVVEL